MSDTDCIFCAIVADDAERSVVYEDHLTLAFMDLMPITPGHLLVVPKTHAASLADLDAETGGAVMQTAMRCAAALRRSPLRTNGINLFLADGVAAGQEVFHVHQHVVPRYPGDGFELRISYGVSPTRARLDADAAEIADAVGHG